jgi:hypothetical protein
MYFTDFATVRGYIFLRSGVEALLSSTFRINHVVKVLSQTHQWAYEVETWFVTAFIKARYALLQVVRRQGPYRDPNT